MNLIKWALWLIVFLVVVAIGGAIFLAQTVDPNSFKAQISEKLEQQIGRKLQLDGDISWRFYPSLGLTLNDFALSNRVGFTPENMLSAEKAEVQVKLLPLIEKKLEVGKVKLIAPKVFLAINAKGESNWADLSQSNKQTLTTNPEQQASAALGGLVIQGVDISNGEVHWDNAQADQHYVLNAFNLTTGAVIPGKATDFDLSSEVSSPSFTESGDVQAKGALWVSEAFDALKLTGFTTQVNLGDINADLQANTIEYSLASGVAMIDQLSYSGEYAQLPIKGALSGLRFDGEKNSVSIAQKTLNTTLAGVSANLEAAQLDVDLNRGVLLAPSLKIQANDAQLDVSLKVVDLFDQLKASGKLSSNTLKPKDLLAALGVDALDEMPEQALAALQLETGFTAGLNSIALDNLQLRLDDSTITGDFSMADFSSPAYRFNLAVDKLNADNYMSTDNKQVAEKTGPGAVVALPFAALKGLDVKGTLSITELDILEMASHDVKVNIDTTADKITISPLSAKVYGGVTRNTFSYDISGDIPKVEIESTLESLNLGPFLQAMQMTDRLEGFGNVSTQIQSSGLTADEIIASMQGDIHISLNDGALRGANIQKTLVDASKLYKQLKGKELDLGAELEDETKFSKLSSDIKVNQGIL
ncbi:MAG: AsmA family protein, partial [Arenicellales bacterium]